ncbi:MAG TPA: LysR family transcriptional regulator, partial [Actinomycetota bacterium]|nr:LysR family transcriptional regulator [Actinomycetota bacterium]
MMTSNSLRAFLELARSGSVRGAAARLHVTQPAVTAAVRSLERELRTPLVTRRGRGIVLTPAGEVLAGYAARVLGLLDETRAAVEEAADPERGRVRLAAVTTAGEHVLPSLIRDFRTRHRGVEVSLEVGNRMRVWERLRDREADLAVA